MMHRATTQAVVIGLLSLNAVVFLAGAWALTRFSFELDYGEGVVLWQADRVLHLREAYHSLDRYPYVVFHYPPLYHLLARLCRIVFPDPLVAGRVVALVSAVGVALLVGLIVGLGTSGRNRRAVAASVIASLLVFHLPNINWVPFMRVDMTALFFSFVGLFVFLRLPGIRGCALAGLAFVAALFTKQSMVAAPGAVLGVLLLAGRTREAVTMVTVMATTCGALAGLLSLATDGEFVRHTVAYNANPFDLAQLAGFMVANLLGMNALAGLALALPLAMLATKRGAGAATDDTAPGRQRVLLTAVLYFVAAFVMSLSAGKMGAWRNYFLEWNLACCILIGLLTGRVLRRGPSRHPSAAATAIVLVVGFVGFARLGTTVQQGAVVAGRNAELNGIAADAGRVLDLMRATPGRVFSDDMTLLVKAGREVPWEPAIATVLAATGAWDERPALEMIRTGRFELIIVRYLDNSLFFSPAIRAAIHHAYTEAGDPAGPYRILRPREVGQSRQAPGG
jgi:hypothetical protein